MAAAIGARDAFGPSALAAAAKRSKDEPQARRLLALDHGYNGARRTKTAKVEGAGLQVFRGAD
jgi:hypothetical protein